MNVYGGGLTGQAEAIRLAIARALVKESPENKEKLKAQSLLTRDSRMVGKKPGQKKARKKFQFFLKDNSMKKVEINHLLDAGVHFGHLTVARDTQI